jgi:Fic family protein
MRSKDCALIPPPLSKKARQVLGFLAFVGKTAQLAAAHFERSRTEYYDRLLRVSTHGDWLGWLRYFLEGVPVQGHAAVQDAERLLDLQAAYHGRLVEAKVRPAARDLVEPLFINPYVNARRATEILNVTSPTARAAIGDLVDHGILREITGRKWGQLFLAEEILAVAQGTTETNDEHAR